MNTWLGGVMSCVGIYTILLVLVLIFIKILFKDIPQDPGRE